MWKKKLKNSILLLAFGLMLLPQSGSGQQAYSLPELIQRSLEHNYQLHIVRNRQQMAENMNTAGNAGMLPSIAAGGQYNRQILDTETNLFTGETRSGSNAVSTSANAYAELNWQVFDGFSMFARRDRLQHLAALGELDTRYYIEQTLSDIALTYYRLHMEELLLDSFRESLEISRFRLQLEDRKRSVGSGNALLYHQALIDFNSDSSLIVNQQMLVRDLQIRMNRIVNFEAENAFVTAMEGFSLQGIDEPGTLREKALAANRQAERAKLEELIAEATARAERGQRYPQLNVFAGYGYNRQTSELGLMQSSRSFGPNLGLSLRFNLYDGGRQNTRIRNAALEQQNAELFTDDIDLLLDSELARLHNTYGGYALQLELLQSSKASTGQTLEIAARQYESGTISGFDFRQTQLAALQLENQIIRLQFDMKALETDLLHITGQLLPALF